MPGGAGTLVFKNGAQIHYGGIHDASSWYGGNVHFALFDEASSYPDASAFKSLLSRARLTGPMGEPPQVAVTTTPEMNWLYEFFGGVEGRDLVDVDEKDPYRAFKRDALVVKLETEENIDNLDPGYVEDMRRTLTPEEFELYMQARWISIATSTKFVEMLWWDNCHQPIPPVHAKEPMVLGVDAAKGGATNIADCFAVVGVTRMPGDASKVAVRYAGIWQPSPGQTLDFDQMEAEILRLCENYMVIEVAYDPYQLHHMMGRIAKRVKARVREFNQQSPRIKSDKALQDLILNGRVAHDGNPLLRNMIDNCDLVRAGRDGLRIVKRSESLKVDAAVALSMAAERILWYNLG